MPKPRKGYQTLAVQLPTVLVQRIYADAARQHVSATQVMIGDYLAKYGLTRADIPQKPMAGRKAKWREM